MSKPSRISTCQRASRRPTDCGPHATRSRPRSLGAIVRAYLKLRPDNGQWGLDYYADAPDLVTAIERAALSETEEGKRHSHQRRIPGRVLMRAKSKLLKTDLTRVEDFEDLHDRVQTAIGRIKGIGDLAVYDISHRLGVYLGLRPEYVYLHCGTRKGAKALGLHYTAARLPVIAFPAQMRKLRPDQIEDCLCIFKDDFREL